VTELIPRAVPPEEVTARQHLAKAQTRQEAESQEAFDREVEIKQMIHHIRTSWIELAAKLYDFMEAEHWRSLGHDSVQEWMAQADVGLEWRQVYAYIQAYREWIVKRNVDPSRVADIAIGRLREVTPAVQRGLMATEDALADAESLSVNDLRDRYKNVKVAVESALDADTEPRYFTCSSCGSRVRRREG
jgi:hypothetical protein